MAEMTEEQMRKLLESDADRTKSFTQEEMDEMQRELDEQKTREEEDVREDFSPGLEEDRTRNPIPSDISDEEFEKMSDELAAQLGLDEGEDTEDAPMFKEGGSVEREADFVKDDDEEPADPPPGATPEEVADDIPAYLSTGEYVLPANVVRYLGLERIVTMHKGALAALQQMEDLDIIENVDENGKVEEDDNEMDYLKQPKGVVKTTLVVAKPHPGGMMALPFQEGGLANDPRYIFIPGVGYRLRSPEGLKDITEEDEDDKDKKKLTEDIKDISDPQEEDEDIRSMFYEGSLEERKDFADTLTSNTIQGAIARAGLKAAELTLGGLMSGPFGAANVARAMGLAKADENEIARQRNYLEELATYDKAQLDALQEVEDRTGTRPDIGNLSGFGLGYASRAQEDAEAKAEDDDDYSEAAIDSLGQEYEDYDESAGDPDPEAEAGGQLKEGGFITRKRYGGLMG